MPIAGPGIVQGDNRCGPVIGGEAGVGDENAHAFSPVAYEFAIHEVDAAFGFVLTAPAAGAGVFAGGDRLRCRACSRSRDSRAPPADAGAGGFPPCRSCTSSRVQWASGLTLIRPVAVFGFEEIEGCAAAGLKAFAPGDPAVKPVQGVLQRRGLAQGAAGVGVVLMQGAVRVLAAQILIGRTDDAQVCAGPAVRPVPVDRPAFR